MTYEDEPTREAFHLLPTEEQLAWLDVENKFSAQGYIVHIVSVDEQSGELAVGARVVRLVPNKATVSGIDLENPPT